MQYKKAVYTRILSNTENGEYKVAVVQLSFESGKFVLDSTTPFGKRPQKLDHNKWDFVSGNTFQTSNLKAAAEFRHVSDDKAERIFKRAFSQSYDDVPLLPPLLFLDAHQREGVQWILTRSRSYLAHAPGAGKTCQAICAANLITSPGPILFIVPPTLTQNWQREVLHFSELMGYHPTVSIVPTSDKKLTMNWLTDFLICPDSMLTKSWVYPKLLKLKPKFIAVDEASRFKDPFSQRSLAFYGGKHEGITYPGLFQDAYHTVFLDGSPMPNRPMELWAPAFALDPLSIDCMGYYDFGFTYCGAVKNDRGHWEFKGSTNETQLNAKLRRSFMHVVTEDKLSHPERLRSILVMNEDVRTPKMKTWEKKNISTIRLTDINETISRGEIATNRKELGIRKAKWVGRYVRDRLKEKRESILLFAWHREVCEALSRELKEFKPFIIYGGVSLVEREKAFSLFQKGERSLLIGNIQACGRGHNLQRADRVIFAEYAWSDELNKQCEKRSSRRGNNKANIRCEYIVVPDSMDEIVLQSIFRKEKTVKRVIG